MASFLAGQRLAAGALNALATWSVPIAAATTSGTTALTLSPTLTIPAAPIDRLITPKLELIAGQSDGSDRFMFRIRSGTGTGTIRAQFNRPPTGTTATASVLLFGEEVLVPAGASHTFVATIERLGGSGTCTVGAQASGSLLSATATAAP